MCAPTLTFLCLILQWPRNNNYGFCELSLRSICSGNIYQNWFQSISLQSGNWIKRTPCWFICSNLFSESQFNYNLQSSQPTFRQTNKLMQTCSPVFTSYILKGFASSIWPIRCCHDMHDLRLHSVDKDAGLHLSMQQPCGLYLPSERLRCADPRRRRRRWRSWKALVSFGSLGLEPWRRARNFLSTTNRQSKAGQPSTST